MSDYFFGTGTGLVSARAESKINAIAKKHGAGFTNHSLAGDGPRYWFAAPNRGEPFNEDTATAVLAECEPIFAAERKAGRCS